MDEIAAELGGKGVVAKINVDDNKEAARKHKIRGIPSLLVIVDGREVERVPVRSKEQVKAAFKRHL